jgi:c-di-AMP phosphodiesterase-like protein
MKEVLAGVLKYIKILLMVLIVIGVILVVISRVFEILTSVVFYYAAMISFVVGFLSVSGNMKGTGNPHYIHSVSASSRSMSDSARESMKLRDSSFGFMIFMTIIGVLLMIISNILARAGL